MLNKIGMVFMFVLFGFSPLFCSAKVNENNVSNLLQSRKTLYLEEDSEFPSEVYTPHYEDDDFSISGANNKLIIYDKKKDEFFYRDFDNDGFITDILKIGDNYIIVSKFRNMLGKYSYYALDAQFNVLNRVEHKIAIGFNEQVVRDKYFVAAGDNMVTIYDNNLDVVRKYHLDSNYSYIYIYNTSDYAFLLFNNSGGCKDGDPSLGMYLSFDNLPPSGNVTLTDVKDVLGYDIEELFLDKAVDFKYEFHSMDNYEYDISLIDSDFSIVKTKNIKLPHVSVSIKADDDYIYLGYNLEHNYCSMEECEFAFKFDSDLNYLESVDNPFRTIESDIMAHIAKEIGADMDTYINRVIDNHDGSFTYDVTGFGVDLVNISNVVSNKDGTYSYVVARNDKASVRTFSRKEKKDIYKVDFLDKVFRTGNFIKYDDFYLLTTDFDNLASFYIMDSNYKVLKKFDIDIGEERIGESGKIYLKDAGFYYEVSSYKRTPEIVLNPKIELVNYDMLFFPKVLESSNGDVSVSVTPTTKGSLVSVSVLPKDGYKFIRLKVLDSLNKEVNVKGTSFVMPNSDVTIEAIFEPIGVLDNPNTSDVITILGLVLSISLLIGFYFYNKKKSLE